MNQKLLALYGLKWNPFTPEVPTEALYVPPKVENFCWRIEQAHLREGGFALIHGDPGSGKSVVMRLLAERLARLADLSVGVIHHPQSNLSDSTANSAISSRSPSASATVGAASRRCAPAGSII
jgi:type II secretory pathway predicted ATPase ExeA